MWGCSVHAARGPFVHREIGVKSDKSVSQGGFVALFEHELRRGLQGTSPISLELDSALATSFYQFVPSVPAPVPARGLEPQQCKIANIPRAVGLWMGCFFRLRVMRVNAID